jgi:hypothetical protein
VTCQAWKEQKKISAQEGLIAIAYERKQQQYSRIYQVFNQLALLKIKTGLE